MARNENMKLTEAQKEILQRQIPMIIANLLNLEEGQAFEYTIEMDKNECDVNFWSVVEKCGYFTRGELLIGSKQAKIEGGIVE